MITAVVATIAAGLLILRMTFPSDKGEQEQEFIFDYQMVPVMDPDGKTGFYMGKYPVTQVQWKAILGDSILGNRSHFKGDNLPVESVSWDDAQVFLRRLNLATGKNYRLPTEAEWEYAARGGNKSQGFIYAGSNRLGSVAWHRGNYDRRPGPINAVGLKKPNELGLYDMSGNVAEWTSTEKNGAYVICGSSSFCSRERSALLSKGEAWYASARRNTFGFRLAHDKQ